MKKFIAWLLVGCLLPLSPGCMTRDLWHGDLSTNYNAPAPYPNLKVYAGQKKKDFLVQYDEVRDRNASIRRRSYWLLENEPKITAGKKPSFVSNKDGEKLPAIPVLTNMAPDTTVTNVTGYWVQLFPDRRHFVLNSGDAMVGQYFLPAYSDTLSRFEVVGLTPFAVVTDVVICGVVAGLVVGVIYAYGEANKSSY